MKLKQKNKINNFSLGKPVPFFLYLLLNKYKKKGWRGARINISNRIFKCVKMGKIKINKLKEISSLVEY